MPCPQIIPRVLHDAQHELGAHARIGNVRAHVRESSRLSAAAGAASSSAHSENPSISSATRRETPRLVSYATIDLAGFDTIYPSPRTVYSNASGVSVWTIGEEQSRQDEERERGIGGERGRNDSGKR